MGDSLVAIDTFRYTNEFLIGSVPKCRNFLVDVLPFYDDARFQVIARVNRQTFEYIYHEIKNDDVFSGPNSFKQFPVKIQLLITLYKLGASGEGGTLDKISKFVGIGDGGTANKITCRVFEAILKLKSKYLFWPNEEERKEIIVETRNEMPHCIGYVDGCEVKLSEKPCDDGESYFSRKQQYSIKLQAVCDYRLKIRHIVVGYPGSVHDSRIYRESSLSINLENYFNNNEYILGDSAYQLTNTVVTPYRANACEATFANRAKFNRTLSKYRIRIENCFGALKERFGSLKELRIRLKDKKSNLFAIKWITCCCILHNIIVEQNDGTRFDDVFETTENIYEEEGQQNSTVSAELKRRAIMEILL